MSPTRIVKDKGTVIEEFNIDSIIPTKNEFKFGPEERKNLFHKVLHALAATLILTYCVLVIINFILNNTIEPNIGTLVATVVGFYFGQKLNSNEF